MPNCHFPVYNSATGLCEKHNTTITNIIGVSGICPLDPNHIILITSFGTSSSDVILNTSYNNSISAFNSQVQILETSSSNQASQGVDINTIISNEIVDMNLNIIINILNPVVKADYKPIEKIKKTDIVKKS